jgi:hypothetical protein
MVQTIIAWVVITIGLAGVVGGLGMFSMYSLLPAPKPGDAEERAFVGGRYLPWSMETVVFCGGGGAGVVIGAVLTVEGLNLRKDPSGTWKRRKRGEKRVCVNCRASNAPGTRTCYRCGKRL